MCKEFSDKGHCLEMRAEHVSDPEKANFCDYFAPSFKQFSASDSDSSKADDAKAKLAVLFGEADKKELSDKVIQEQDHALTPAQIAEKKLRDMFGD